jgi:alginate O-acetyltransferase complex protein AlgI
MLFTSPLFLFFFLPLTIGCYLAAPRRLRNPVALLASLSFYAWGEPIFIGVVVLSAFVDWILGRAIYGSQTPRASRVYLAAGVTLNLGILILFKYSGFFLESANGLLALLDGPTLPIPAIALPIGVSFIVFEKITYLVDLYRKVGRPADSLATYMLYVFLFPKLLAGPIIKYHDIEQQLLTRGWALEDVSVGIIRFTDGLAKKVWIADPLGVVVDEVFGLARDDLAFPHAWLGLVCFTLQIYFDFSGYSDMAIGLARVMGFRLLENFNVPYMAENFTDFWRRWHISLSSWIRQYLYVPLGGNRVSVGRAYFNLWFCFFLSGLWHGAKWTFIVWGVYHGIFLIVDKLFWLRVQRRLPAWLNIGLTFGLVSIGWVIFRAADFSRAGYYLAALFNPTHLRGKFLYVGDDVFCLVAVGLILCFVPGTRWYARATSAWSGRPYSEVVSLGLACVVLLLAVAKISNSTFQPFLYFRF